MMTTIYQHHDAAFTQVSAGVILKDGEKVGTIAFKYPRDGAGRLWCYLHLLGSTMVRGSAAGYGYDKRSAALEVAAANYEASNARAHKTGNWDSGHSKLLAALASIGGSDAETVARSAGYLIVAAV